MKFSVKRHGFKKTVAPVIHAFSGTDKLKIPIVSHPGFFALLPHCYQKDWIIWTIINIYGATALYTSTEQ